MKKLEDYINFDLHEIPEVCNYIAVDDDGEVWAYETIPVYASPITTNQFNLRDCLDFRPVRKNATASLGSSVVFDVDASTTGPKIPENGSDILLDYDYYLPRVDKVVLNKNRTFDVIKGTPALNAVPPKDKDDTIINRLFAYFV